MEGIRVSFNENYLLIKRRMNDSEKKNNNDM